MFMIIINACKAFKKLDTNFTHFLLQLLRVKELTKDLPRKVLHSHQQCEDAAHQFIIEKLFRIRLTK